MNASSKQPVSGAKTNTAKPQSDDGAERSPRLPHEQDESADSQQAASEQATRVGAQAHEDVSRGLVDTDRGESTDKLYHRIQRDSPRR